ncbi:MAG: FliA/WhiG family RNA polymerase sigma factor, partial [Acidobacteriota bacterium]
MSRSGMRTYAAQQQAGGEERERLILEHLPQVRLIARRIHERLPESVSLEDLVSTGVVGLISAIDHFKPEHNVKLKTYAEYKIRGAILDSIRGLDGVPGHHRKKLRIIDAAIFAVEQRVMRPPTDDEIAKELGISTEEYRRWLEDVRGVTLGSLDVVSDNGEGVSMLRYLADKSEDEPGRMFERAELERILEEAVGRMPNQERMILDLYYRQELTLREIGEIFDLHITRISQLKAQAVLRLRTYVLRIWPTERGVL